MVETTNLTVFFTWFGFRWSPEGDKANAWTQSLDDRVTTLRKQHSKFTLSHSFRQTSHEKANGINLLRFSCAIFRSKFHVSRFLADEINEIFVGWFGQLHFGLLCAGFRAEFEEAILDGLLPLRIVCHSRYANVHDRGTKCSDLILTCRQRFRVLK